MNTQTTAFALHLEENWWGVREMFEASFLVPTI
jgi:hypothetical protein